MRLLSGYRITPILVCIFSVIFLNTICVWSKPGDIIDYTHESTYTADEITKLSVPLFKGFDIPRAHYSVELYLIRYRSTDFNGTSTDITAQLFIPRFQKVVRRPVYVFGSGTTGIADKCAPSLEKPGSTFLGFGHYRTNMLAYAGQGYIVIFPDYLGFNDGSRPQRYFSKKAEGHVMLDAIRAVYNFFIQNTFNVNPSKHVFTAGYSQGGHAAMAAADLRSTYAPEIPVTGMIGYGTTNDVQTLMKEAPVYSPYILYSYAEMYGWDEIEPSLYLQERYASSLSDDVNRMCVDEAQRYYPNDGRKLYTEEFYQALYNGNLDAAFPALSLRLKENKTGLDSHGTPALIIQGLKDSVVTTASQTSYVKELRSVGSPVKYLTLEQVWHRHTRPAGFAWAIKWMEELSAGDG